MPLSRYQIRNEYNLADPDLYKVADKDDPEALLEGVAMAGLVGVLRQLGDLAQFAAEIFHDLHEEVMATAARGHGLIARVQQLEAEFPLVERTLLSQTSHTAFLYNSGIDWHCNGRMDENLVTQGDLPRFVMDSYEECRGPPRLFLLDKFDVAGAGACLKRFTDPSFFKAEAILTGKKLDGQREKRARRVKKRGPRWRNEATPETFPSSHAKLHQLFLEELIETGGNDPDRRVKLKKRQFTGSLFDQDKRKSYMENFLDSCSPEQKIVHEVCIDALPLTWTSDNGCESGLEIVEIGTDSPHKQPSRSSRSSRDISEMVVKPFLGGFRDGKLDDVTDSEAVVDPCLSHDSDDGKISSAIYRVKSEGAFADRQSKSKFSDDDCRYSDGFASEIDNYMDALATMESEVESDSECNNNQHYLNLKPIVVDSDASEGLRDLHGLFSDSQSLGNSSTSEDGNNFLKERQSSSRSMSVNSVTQTRPYLNAVVTAVPSVPPSSLVADSIALEHHFTSDDVPNNKTEACTMRSALTVKADEISNTVQKLVEGVSNHSILADPNTAIRSVDEEATPRENSLPSSGLDELCSNQANSGCFVRTAIVASERIDSGHWSDAQQPMHDLASHSSSACSGSSPDSETTGNVLLQIEPKKADSASSVVEHSGVFGMADVSAVSDPNAPEIVKPTCGASNLDFCITLTEEHSDDRYYAPDSRRNFNNQEQCEMTNPDHTSPPDYDAAAVPSSQGDSSSKEVFANVEGEDTVLSAPIVSQTENLPLPLSSGLQTCASEFSLSVGTDAAGIAEYGSLEAAIAGDVSSGVESNGGLHSGSADGEMIGGSTMMENSFPVVDPSETEDRLQGLLSEITDAAAVEHHLAETGKQYAGSDSSEVQNSVCTGGEECKVALDEVAFDRDVCQHVTPVYCSQSDAVDIVEHLDKNESRAVQADTATGDCNSVHDDKSKAFSLDKCPFDGPSKLPNSFCSISAAEGDSNQPHGMGRVVHRETSTNDSRQVDVEGYSDENSLLPSSSSVCLEEVLEQSVAVTDNYHPNEDELVRCPSAELVAQENVNPVLDAAVNPYYSTCSMSSDGYPDLISPNSTVAEDAPSIINSDVIEVPIISESGCQDLDSTSSHLMHLPEGMEERMVSRSQNLSEPMIPGQKRLDLHDDESQVKWLLANQQIHTPEYSEENSASLHDHGQPSMRKLLAQSAGHVLGSFTQPMVECASFFSENNMLSGSNQATQMVENLGQPIQTPGFPVLGVLPAEQQINLDSPPLPPLPPMQWRLSRFQSSSTAAEGQMAQCIRGPVQPMTLPGNDYETDPFSHTSNSSGQPVCSNDSTEQRVNMQSSLASVSMVSLENNINGIQREELSVTNPTTTRSLSGPQIPGESYQRTTNFVEPESLANHACGDDSLVMEAKVDAKNDVQNRQLEHIPLVTEQEAVNSHVHFLPPSPVHCDWQAPPGLMAPEARRTCLSAYDGLPTDQRVYTNGALQKKPPRPRNPLIDEVVAIDKSKLRKVERVKPSVESKPEGGESFLEQLQLRKVERVKPPMESKAEEGESPLEHLQLRKVRERVKPPVEPKSEEREFSRRQLRLRKVEKSVKPQTLKTERELTSEQIQLKKVGDRVKSEAEQKAEETESLRVQLRKARERVKLEVEQKPEEAESPRVQLRKVTERVKPEVQCKPEETESPPVQLRKVIEKFKQEVYQKPEETESPRVQLRKVGQTATASVAPKTEDRDSILEQIRNKSFSLKRAVAARPNIQGIQGSRTNLKVAAIIEKASTIRQAMAGSDEEDDADNWSDC